MKKIIFPAVATLLSLASFAQTDSSAIYLQKALEEKARGRKMEVVKNLEKAEKFSQKNSQVVEELALAYLDVRLLPKAKETFLRLEALGNVTSATYKQLMHLHFNLRQFPEAVKYASLVKSSDASEKVAYVIGRSYYEMDDLGNGIKYLVAALSEEPANAQISYLLATAYTNMQNFRQAIPYFEKTLALEPTNARFTYELALAYYGMGDDKNALKYMLEAGEKGIKKDAEYMQNLSTALMNGGKFSEGLEMMKQTLARRPTDVGLLDMMAEACYDAGKWDEAIDFYNQLLAVDEKNAEALYMMGMTYQKKGKADTGRALCDKAIAMDPKLSSLRQEKKMPGGM